MLVLYLLVLLFVFCSAFQNDGESTMKSTVDDKESLTRLGIQRSLDTELTCPYGFVLPDDPDTLTIFISMRRRAVAWRLAKYQCLRTMSMIDWK